MVPKIKLIDGKIFGHYTGMAIPPFLIIVSKKSRNPMKTIRHEWTHVLQAVELWYFGFYLLYFISWLIVGFKYRKIWFEREAHYTDESPFYNGSRKKFSWLQYVRDKCDSVRRVPDHPVEFSHHRQDGKPVLWCKKCFTHIHVLDEKT